MTLEWGIVIFVGFVWVLYKDGHISKNRKSDVSKSVKDMINLQNNWNKVPYNRQEFIRNSRKDFAFAYEMYDNEKQRAGSLESRVFCYEDRVNYISAFCIMFQNLYRERKGYYDGLIEYWGDEK